MPRGRPIRNDVLLEMRARGKLVDRLRQLGLTKKSAQILAENFPDGRGLSDEWPGGESGWGEAGGVEGEGYENPLVGPPLYVGGQWVDPLEQRLKAEAAARKKKKRNPQSRAEKRKRKTRLDAKAILRRAMRGT